MKAASRALLCPAAQAVLRFYSLPGARGVPPPPAPAGRPGQQVGPGRESQSSRLDGGVFGGTSDSVLVPKG